MDGFEFVGILFVVGIIIGVIRIFSSIRNITKVIYYFLFGVTNLLLTPISSLHDKLVSAVSETKIMQIKNLDKNGRFDAWGGVIQFFIGAVIAVLTLAAIIHQCLTNPPIWDNEDILFRSPTFYLISLISGESPFTLSSVTELCVFGAFAALCFRKATELSGVRRYVYEVVFLLFSVLAPEYLPDWIYDIPEKLTNHLFEFVGTQSEGILEVLKFILLISSIIIIGYLLLLVYSIALREIAANITFSLWPICALGVFMFVFEQLPVPESLYIPICMIALLITSFLFQRDRVVDDDNFVESWEKDRERNRWEREQRKSTRKAKRKNVLTLPASYFFGIGDKFSKVVNNKLYLSALILLTAASAFGIFGGLFPITQVICSFFMWQCYLAVKNKTSFTRCLRRMASLTFATYIIIYIFVGIFVLLSISTFFGFLKAIGDAANVASIFLFVAAIIFFINFCYIRKIYAFTKSLSICANDFMGNGKIECAYETKRSLMRLGIILAVFGIVILAMGIMISSVMQIIMAVSIDCLAVCFILVSRLIKKSFLFM